MKFKTIILLFVGLLFSCNHKDLDFEMYILNETDSDINVTLFFSGMVDRSIDINSGGKQFYVAGGGLYTGGDSVVIKKTNGDSIVYHHPEIDNSNYEQTQARSYFSESNWVEIVDKNKFEYTVLPEDFK